MNVHRIRLRAPWGEEFLDAGVVRWSRRFHRPTNLTPSERVWLVMAGASAGGTVWLNDQVLGPLVASVEARFEVASLLVTSNRLVLEFAGPRPPATSPQPPVEVWLEIG